MKLLRLKASNVFSIGEVEVDLKDRGLTLVTGWSYDENNGNMAGKSSVANRAISWGLYGRTVDGVRADDVINTSSGRSGCSVGLDFVGIDGQTYRILRTRNPNALTLFKGEENLTKRLEKETQETIDHLLGRDHKTFIQSDFFGQGRERSFLSLPSSEQRAVIEEILPLTSLTDWHKNTKDKISSAQEAVNKAHMNLSALTVKTDVLKNKTKDMAQQASGWGATRTVEISRAEGRLRIIKGMSADIEKELKSLYDALPAGTSVEQYMEEQNIRLMTLTKEVNNLQYIIDSLTKEVDWRGSRSEICIECGQGIPTEKISQNEDIVKQKKEDRATLVKEKAEKEVFLYDANANLGICHEILKVRARLQTKAEEATISAWLKEKQAEKNPFERVVSQYTEELKQANEDLEGAKVTLDRAKAVLEHYKFWEVAFGKDIKTLLFDRVCPYLEARANQYLKELNNEQIKVKFSTNKELKSGDSKDQFCVTAGSDTGSSIFELFSGAEKQLTSFAVGMALSDLASMQTTGASQFMILDEPFLYQSPENCENLINFITQKLGKTKSTILLISNEDNLVNLVPNRIHIVKRNGVSSIE